MIVLGLLALVWWLGAPDRFTAGARTAAGTAGRAAGTGAKVHWNEGRDGRKATRTDRRARWDAKGGWWRRLLGLEHAAVVTGKTAKGTGQLAAAAVRPVPAAIKDGWRKSQDAHRARVEGKRVPLAVNPPWWHPKPKPVPGQGEDSPQDSPGTGQDSPAGQPEDRPTAVTVLGEKSAHCSRCLSPVGRYWAECPTCQATLSGLMTASGKYLPSADTAAERIPPAGRIPTDPETLSELIRQLPTGRDEYGEPYVDDVVLFGRLRDQEGDAATGIWSRAITPVTPPAGTDPAGTTTPSDNPGGTVSPTPFGAELDDLTSVQDFAVKVADMAEESDFAQLVEFCKHASDETRDFGADMAGDVAEFEEIAAKIGDLLSELVDAAQHVRDRSAELIGG